MRRACAPPPTSCSPAARPGNRGAPMPPSTLGPPTPPRSQPPRGPGPMPAAPPETLTLDRIPTPIGTALVVTDEAGTLRAFNWTDYEASMQAWLGKRFPNAPRREGRSPIRGAFDAYFGGEVGAL